MMLLVLGAPVPSLAAGPWQALVVDAETQAPLEGVAVLARWYRRAQGHPAIGLGERDFTRRWRRRPAVMVASASR